MAYFERIKDVVTAPFSPDVIQRRAASGWQMVSIEWRRELPDGEAPAGLLAKELPQSVQKWQGFHPDSTSVRRFHFALGHAGFRVHSRHLILPWIM